MPRISKIALFHALVGLLAFDVHAIAQRFLQASRDLTWGLGALALGVVVAALSQVGLGTPTRLTPD